MITIKVSAVLHTEDSAAAVNPVYPECATANIMRIGKADLSGAGRENG